jgi:hypothetical protein
MLVLALIAIVVLALLLARPARQEYIVTIEPTPTSGGCLPIWLVALAVLLLLALATPS